MASIRCLACKKGLHHPLRDGDCTCKAERWEVRYYAGTDPVTGRERTRSATVRGSRTAVRRRAAELEAAKDAAGAATKGTMGHLLDRWLADFEAKVATGERSPTTIATYRRLVANHIRPALGAVPLDRLSAEHLDGFYRAMRVKEKVVWTRSGHKATGRPLDPRTGEQCHAIVSAALNQAVRWGWVPRNVAAQADPPRPKATKKRALPVEQVARILRTAWERNPDMAVMLTMSASTGKRRGEACAVRRGDFERFFEPTGAMRLPLLGLGGAVGVGVWRWRLDFARNVVVVKGGVMERPTTKTDAANTRVRLAPFVALLIERITAAQDERARAAGLAMAPDPFLFSCSIDGATPYHPDSVTGFWRRLRSSLGLMGVKLKDLRDFVATISVRAGIDMKTVQGQLAHSQISTTANFYTIFMEEGSQEVADLMGGVLAGALPPAPEPIEAASLIV